MIKVPGMPWGLNRGLIATLEIPEKAPFIATEGYEYWQTAKIDIEKNKE